MQIAIYMAEMHLCHARFAPLAGGIVDRFGYGSAFLEGLRELNALALLPLCDERTADERFRPSDTSAVSAPAPAPS